jgi:TRAP-type C4-dicarboxylate transport system permease small subunit
MLDLFGLSLQSKMLVRLYALPILLVFGALIALIVHNNFQVNTAQLNALSVVNNLIYTGSWWASMVLLASFCITFLYSSFRLWQWDKGEDAETCHVCGGMAIDKNGKYGPYYKCLACGTNRSMYR